VHFDADQHQKLGCTLTEKVIDILG
jgi:hypothetical protein